MLSLGRDIEDELNELTNRKFYGVVVDNNDPEKLQRIKLRIAGLHDDLKDEDLPWTFPSNANTHNNGGGTTGQLGPIPPVGTKLHMKYHDDSMYHGYYEGSVTTKEQRLKSLTTGDHGKDYPNVHGTEDASGTLHAINTKRDTVDYTHVSGTGWSIDGSGNLQVNVNGGYDNKNKDATKGKYPTGANFRITGNATVVIDGGLPIQATGSVSIVCNGDASIAAYGNTSISCNGNAAISAKGNASVACNGNASLAAKGNASVSGDGGVTVSAGGALNLVGSSIALSAGAITSSVPIVLGGGGSHSTNSTVGNVNKLDQPQALTGRSRPTAVAVNDSTTD